MKVNDFIGGDYKYFKIRYLGDKWGTVKTTDVLIARQIQDAGGIGISLKEYVVMRLGEKFWDKWKHKFAKMQPSEMGSLIGEESEIVGLPNANNIDYEVLEKQLSNNRM